MTLDYACPLGHERRQRFELRALFGIQQRISVQCSAPPPKSHSVFLHHEIERHTAQVLDAGQCHGVFFSPYDHDGQAQNADELLNQLEQLLRRWPVGHLRLYGRSLSAPVEQ